MNRVIWSWILIFGFIFWSCKKEQPVTEQSDYSGQLTQTEIQNGKLTPEVLWKFGRMADMQLSPDGTAAIYNVTRYDVKTNQSITEIWKVPAAGGDAIKITPSDSKYVNPRWNPAGTKIGFLSPQSGSFQLWEINPDGSLPARKSDFPFDLNTFEYSPDGGRSSLQQTLRSIKTLLIFIRIFR